MKEYFKIVLSIIASLLILSTCFSIAIGISEFYGRGEYWAMIMPYFVVTVGLVMFGILGSAFWFSILALISGVGDYSFRAHVVSACLSTLITVTLVSLLISGANFSRFLEGLTICMAVVPVVALSILILWVLFYRKLA